MLKHVIQKDQDPAPILDHLTDAFKEYNSRLSNFLQYTRADAGIVDSFPEQVNVRHLLSKLIEEHDYLAIEKQIGIDLLVSQEIPEQILSDEFKVSQIAANLLINAIAFSAPGSQVSLEIDKTDKWWKLVVKDKGEGMTADQLECLFSLSPAGRKKLRNPMGLGLLVSRYLAEDVLKGKLSLISQAGIGTEVIVQFPLN